MVKQLLGGFGLLAGASYPLRSLRIFHHHPRLWSYLIVPILLNLVLGIGIYTAEVAWGWNASQEWMMAWTLWADGAIGNLPPWLGFVEWILVGLAWLLRGLIGIVFLLVTGFILAQFGVLLGAPWYSQLSEQLEKIKTGRAITLEVGILGDLGRSLLFELKKLLLIIVFGIPLVILHFIPGIGTVLSVVGGIGLTALLVCLDFLDAPLERRRLTFRSKLGLVGKSLPASAGFSLVCLILSSIPLVNLITIPLCVAGGTLFFCDRIYPSLPPTNRRPKNPMP